MRKNDDFTFDGIFFVLNLHSQYAQTLNSHPTTYMKLKHSFTFILLAASLALTSCAVDKGEDTGEFYTKELRSWVKVNYPDKVSETTSDGSYIIDFKQGDGAQPRDTDFVYVHYCSTDLEGNIISTNIKSLVEQIGSFSYSGYYGSRIWQIGKKAVAGPVEEALRKMKVGGHARLAIPASSFSVEYSFYDAFDSEDEQNILFDIYLDDVASDVYERQKSALKEYSRRYSDYDSTSDIFYFKRLTKSEAASDSLKDEENLDVRYVGRLLDGTVFDTNIADTAKKYRIFDETSSYDALSMTYRQKLEDMIDNNSTVNGFTIAVWKLRAKESGVTFFDSTLGYKESGGGMSIPEYSPLCFYIYIEKD